MKAHKRFPAMKKILISIMMITAINAKAQGQGRDSACGRAGGHVVFIDMLYGLGVGGIFSGLILVASEDDNKVGRKVATGSLIGATAGMGLGMYELSTRECLYTEGEKSRVKPTIVYRKDLWGISLAYKF